MFIFTIIVSACVQSIVALFVLLKNPKSLTNILFFLLSVLVIVWAIINFLITDNSVLASQVIWYRAMMGSVVLQNVLFFLFAHTFPNDKLQVTPGRLKLYVSLSVVAFIAALSPYVFAGLNVDSGHYSPFPGPGMAVFILHALISVGFGFRVLLSRYKRSVGGARNQLRFILIGSVILWGVVPVTNFIIPLATDTSFFSKISPIYTLVFSSIIAYAIVRQKLFDIRAAVARSVGYTLTLVSLAAFYIIVAFALPSHLLNVPVASIRVQIVYALLALVMAFSFSSVKRSFDELSNRFFYQDAYDPQELLNKINRVLATTTHFDQLLAKTLNLMEESLKSEYSIVVLKSAESLKPRVVMSGKNVKLSTGDVNAYLAHVSSKGAHTVTVTDYISYDHASLRELLTKNQVAVMARLGKHHQAENTQIGYILLGAKRSGNLYTKDDIRVIEIIANELVVAIQNALRFEEIERFNETLQQKVTDATRRLSESNHKLKVLNETKDDFIGMASHQLRTPLTSVKGYLSLVIDGDAGHVNETQKKLLTQAFVSSQRMVYLIADLLNVSRLRTGKFLIERTPTNVATMISDEIGQLREMAASRGVELSYEPPAEFPDLPLDETKTRQVVMNFIDNAVYYTPTGGHIRVEVKELPKSVELRVIDDGIGVPKQEHHHLFTKFYRAKNAQRARPDGTGLGLFMAKKVIIAQGGALIFDSIEGQGSTFGFTFPKDLPTETVADAS